MKNQAKNCTQFFKTFLKLLPFFWTNNLKIRLRIILSLFLVGISVALNIVIPLVYKNAINILSTNNKDLFSLIPIILVLYCCLWIISQIISQVGSVIMFYALQRNLRLLTLRLFTHLHSLSLRFHMDRHTGMVINALERSLSGFEVIFLGMLIFMLPILIEMILVIILLSSFYGISYSIGLLVIMLSYLFFSLIALGYKTEKQTCYNRTRTKTGSYIVDSLLNFETVKYFGNEQYDYEQCNNLLKKQEATGIAKQFSAAIIQICQGIVIGVGLIYMTLKTSSAVISGQMNISDFILINGYLWRFVVPLHQLGHVLQQIHVGINDMSDVIDLLEEEHDIQNTHSAIDIKTNRIDITFDNVVFGYDQQRTILNGISFTVPAGSVIALVGASGAGKSTIARLLFRFYDVNSGQILLNGHNLRDITQESLHALIGVVPQDTMLFNNTLYYNIAYGCPTACQEEIDRAIKLAHLDKLIRKLPAGYNTIVGERGLKLSGGEKQRVAIARMLLKKPQIYVFDEATSSLDSCTEKEIQQNLEEISVGATTLVIAHRLSTIVKANEIIVLNEGLIVERGNHQQLLDFNGFYANLWKKQLQ
jgi:ABC-type transport system involved in Fe-S cluster assembly fused permease/ATPase subunit